MMNQLFKVDFAKDTKLDSMFGPPLASIDPSYGRVGPRNVAGKGDAMDLLPSPSGRKPRLGAWSMGCLIWTLTQLLGCGSSATPVSDSGPPRATSIDSPSNNEQPSPAKRAGQLSSDGRAKQAVSILRQRLLTHPTDYEAIYLLAQAQVLLGELDSASDSLGAIPVLDPQWGIAALDLSASLAHQQFAFDEAETRLCQLLELRPNDSSLRRRLIDVFNQQGRRHEAVALTRELVLSGEVTEFELQTLILEADALYMPASRQPPESQSFPPLKGTGAKGRFLLSNAYFAEAAEVLSKHIQSGQACQSDIAACGTAIAESQQTDQFSWWLDQTTDATQEFPEYWGAIGANLLIHGEFTGAIAALGEAILRDPTDIRSIRRMSKAFHSIGDHETAQLWLKRHQNVASTLQAMPFDRAGRPSTVEDPRKLIDALEAMGRRLEAIHWRMIFAKKQNTLSNELKLSSEFDRLTQQRERSLRDGNGFASREERLCGVRLDDFELPPESNRVRGTSFADRSDRRIAPPVPAKFTNIADEAGLEHSYRVHSTDRQRAFTIYQTFGGGVAVLDFDLDGAPDLYFCQGAAKPPNFLAKLSDLLYRNQSDGDRPQLFDVTKASAIAENDYTLGVTAGDWNQDGYADLVVSNLGRDYLLINQGDGTFVSTCLDPNDSHDRLSTSVAMGDLDGDHLPDLFQLNYLDDPTLVERPPTDSMGRAERTAAPHTFRHALDRVWINDGRSGWSMDEVGRSDKHRSTGLGLIVSDLDATRPGNEVFVANDEQADQFWKFDRTNQSWQEYALQSGLAFGSLGFPVGSMGVAAADFDQSGTLDLHVTTFSQESSCFFLNIDGFFQDRSVRHGIDRISSMFMGFGSQAIDAGNRGAWDLLVTNGHVEDLRHRGQMFKQPVQLLVNEKGKYVNTSVEDPSGYWSTKHLGRALARVDFNRDGRQDFVTTDLIGPSALLINQTTSDHHWLNLQLVGSISERDAVGARVQIRSGGTTWTQWVQSGDGYLCRNENRLHFGVGENESIEQVEIRWPSGTKQSFSDLDVDRHYVLIETIAEAWQTN